MIWVKVIDKILSCLGKIKFRADGARAVVSYVLIPRIKIDKYFRISHNNRLMSYFIAKTLMQMGFDVELWDYLKGDVQPGADCSLYIGHSINFSRIAKRLAKGVPKILIMSGSYPKFGNEQQRIRAENLESRRGIRIRVHEDNIVPDLTENLEMADQILLIGSEFIRDTYPERFRSKMTLFNNIVSLPIKKKDSINRNFLFMSSVGQVHRGLDLVLEAMAGRKEKLYVCSSFHEEPEFEKAYWKELYETENVRAVGYISMHGKRFNNIFGDTGFCILPSCSEGQSSSVINAMSQGLLPIVTRNCGVPDVEKFGFIIEGGELKDVKAAINEALSVSDYVLKEKREMLFGTLPNFTGAEFVAKLHQLVSDLLR